jgi:aryl-alcohol dehydrogenase (NADP+)
MQNHYNLVYRVDEREMLPLCRAEGVGVIPYSPVAQVALAWVLQQPGVTAPIVGASKLEQLDEAIAALDLELDEAERASLEEPYRAREGKGFL